MNCDDIRPDIQTYLDGELDDSRAKIVEEHLEGCGECRQIAVNGRVLSKAIRSSYSTDKVGPELRSRIVARTVGRRSWFPTWSIPFGAGVAAGLALFAFFNRPSVRAADFANQLVASHVRSIGSGLVEVTSSDRHTVKPWFQGKLDFSPEVVDIKSDGFPLVGGRLETVDGHPAAALVFKRKLHVINVFVTSNPGSSASAFDLRGFHGRRFRLGDLDYWAVSDVNSQELALFESDFERAVRGR